MNRRRWQQLSLIEQLANIGAEVGRTIKWKHKDKRLAQAAFYRALALLLETKADPKNTSRLREVCRLNEMLVDWYLGGGDSVSDDAGWEKYFYAFNYYYRRGET